MTFKTLVELNKPTDADYYSVLLQNADIVIKEVTFSDRNTVAERLGINKQTFTTAYKLLVAYERLNYEQNQ